MEAKVSEEINEFLRKNEPRELVFARVLYLDFGGSNRYFCERLYLNSLISHCNVKLSDTERLNTFCASFPFLTPNPSIFWTLLRSNEYDFVQHFVIFLSGNK